MLSAANDYSNMKRLTVTVSDNVHRYLRRNVKSGKVSDYVNDAVQAQISRDLAASNEDPVERFLQAYKKITKKNKISIREAIGRDRDNI